MNLVKKNLTIISAVFIILVFSVFLYASKQEGQVKGIQKSEEVKKEVSTEKPKEETNQIPVTETVKENGSNPSNTTNIRVAPAKVAPIDPTSQDNTQAITSTPQPVQEQPQAPVRDEQAIQEALNMIELANEKIQICQTEIQNAWDEYYAIPDLYLERLRNGEFAGNPMLMAEAARQAQLAVRDRITQLENVEAYWQGQLDYWNDRYNSLI